METQTSKIGTREQVYKGLSLRTAGGLTKNDIIEKKLGCKIIYISKKLSEKMKQNPHVFRKIVRKKTISLPIKQNTQSEIQTSTSKQGPKKPFSSNSNLSISSDSSHDSNCD